MNELADKIQAVLIETGDKNAAIKNIEKLHGDASYRIYYRAFLADGSTRIIMQMPDGPSSASEEITNFKGKIDEPPFINVARFLSSLRLPVPKVLGHSPSKKIIILEDLGDDLFIKKVAGAGNAVLRGWYKKALDLLVGLQTKAGGRSAGDCIAMQRSFDPVLLNWEFDHFREYLVEERLGKKMSKTDAAVFEDVTRMVTSKIITAKKIFTHRDFQSKNLIADKNGSLSMIDFQDALMGPRVYDLVALLRDSYVVLTPALVEELLSYYCKKTGLGPAETGNVTAEFDLVTLQRKMKDSGRFVYIDRVKKNPSFLQYIPATLEYVRNAFERLQGPDSQSLNADEKKKIASLFKLLKKYVPEWN
jgi:aminoglycoside/choline kinase family phosphotransferase